MAAKATVLGGSAKDLALDAEVFEAEVKPHLVHETVRSELNAARSGTRGAKSRGLVSGGRAKPWRQKGTGRARQGTIRAPQFTGGGVAFPPGMRSFDVKVNRKARRAALRGALSHHAANGTLDQTCSGRIGTWAPSRSVVGLAVVIATVWASTTCTERRPAARASTSP